MVCAWHCIVMSRVSLCCNVLHCSVICCCGLFVWWAVGVVGVAVVWCSCLCVYWCVMEYGCVALGVVELM